MAKKSQSKDLATPSEGLKAKGLYRIQIEDDGEIVGDSGWKENQITNLGFNLFLVSTLGKIAGSAQVGYLALGTGGYPNATDVALAGEISGSTARTTVTAATSSTSKTVHFTGTFASANSFLGGSSNISNIGLYNTAGTAGTLFAGNTFASSACATNQNVNCCCAPDVRFLTADLDWVECGELVAGDELVAFDENGSREWRHSIVTRSERQLADCVRVAFGDGREIVCTTDHPFLTVDGDWVIAERLMEDGRDVTDLRKACDSVTPRSLAAPAGGVAVAADPAVLIGKALEAQALAVVSVEAIGEHEIQSITTTTGTYVSEGVASHNTYDITFS